MIQVAKNLYGKTFIPISLSEDSELPYAIDFQSQPTLVIKDNDLFLITDQLGNIVAGAKNQKRTVTGLFCHDTRFLSRSELQIAGQSPVLLSSCAESGYQITVNCTNPAIDNLLKRETIGIERKIVLRGGLFEEITLRNYTIHPVEIPITLSFQADFKDLFEVKSDRIRSQRGQNLQALNQSKDSLNFAYEGLDHSLMESLITFNHLKPTKIQGNTVIWNIILHSQASCRIGYALQTKINNQANSSIVFPNSLTEAVKIAQGEKDSWYQNTTKIRTDSAVVNQVITQAENDIYLLLQSFGQGKILVAGIPWFSTLFGRDSLIAAGQTLMFDSQIARNTLLTLAEYQGKNHSDWHDESPGKILHELRLGELARCQEIPHTPYYGTVDATPLWLILYADYYHWSGDRAFAEKLWSNVLRAMDWIDHQREKTGYIYYLRQAEGGLRNQGWKDSGDCIVNSKGELVEGAIALCEVQGYVYYAKVKLSHIAKILGEEKLAQKWQKEAEELKERFNRDFWLESEQYYALALDENGKPIDSITSNPGHCLSLDICTPEKANLVAKRLMAEDLYSGWGIRTLSSFSPAYNPMGYHLGSVWHHDTAISALGLRHIGKIDDAITIAQSLIEMTVSQANHRPPELFCGFERKSSQNPVKYPVACFPQAWATGTIFQLLQMMINLLPDMKNNRLLIKNPRLPDFINRLSLENLRIGNNLIDLVLEKIDQQTICRITKQEGDLNIQL
ncbi:amylo-alpha-1,6-glucosidase [Cyanobacterium aponinum FACHB-4101]|uniref:amylo-alpha-1,6-glucosidase n=1 Tax=Cyanobacterium aponinum TaxID=379064 RepID=UPI0016800A00|nr:amylo-alpha-1,6-glucosidase [Cyanobacterium aponinum]MBD2395145.1 amylo-alpha-1,6-glucosidase [Cyanobacterium aponinum FACHB-4101]